MAESMFELTSPNMGTGDHDSERMDIITMLRSPGVQSEASVQGGHFEVKSEGIVTRRACSPGTSVWGSLSLKYHRQGESQSLGCRQGIENVGNSPCDGTGKGLGHLLHTVLQPVPVATWSNAWPTASVPTLTTGIALSSNCKVSSSRKQ
ncbi:hypothetical protein Bbelb_406760 [Branchiostoma belcheri]|nr:hypothetical protein Bbelb_406760 [Branchiostoma belcheri]